MSENEEISPVINYDPEELERQGRIIYKSNDTLRNVMNVMEHPEFKKFFDKYFKDWETIKILIMFMKVYNSIGDSRTYTVNDVDNFSESHVLSPNNTTSSCLSPYQRIAILKNMIDDSGFRQQFIGNLVQWSDDNQTNKGLIQKPHLG